MLTSTAELRPGVTSGRPQLCTVPPLPSHQGQELCGGWDSPGLLSSAGFDFETYSSGDILPFIL